MSVRVTEGEASGRGGVFPPVSPSMEGVLPIRGVDVNTGEVMAITLVLSLREAEDPYRADVVRWATLDVPSIMVAEDLKLLREAYMIPSVSSLCSWSLTNEPVFRRGNSLARIPDYLSAEKVFEEERQGRGAWVVLFLSLESHRPLVTDCLSSIKQWKESWFWVAGNWQRVADDPELDLDRPRVLAPGSSEDLRQKKVLEDLSREGNRDEAEAPNVVEIEDTNASEVDVPLTRKRKVETSGVGSSSQSKGKAVEAMKKYFTPRWEEFALHGDLDDVLEVGLAAAIRASRMQLKVLGLQAAVDNMRTVYEHFKADLRESESNVLNLTKQLDNANATQKVVAEALEAANKENKWLLGEAKSHEQETQCLRESLEAAKKRRKEAEAKVARLLGEKKEMEAK
ncbi:hypothetical protein Adt_28185 [Abeliophyllum distichum]|uniref:Uncharacterized protein n=1 Tax=Abeliophyllum distichum TaxID=126358 RepID=A0ABD1RVX3_9LAMI